MLKQWPFLVNVAPLNILGNIVCMTMDGVGFAIQNLLTCPSFERPQALHSGVFSLLNGF